MDLLKWMNHVLSSSTASIPGPGPTGKAKKSTTKDVGENIVHTGATSTSFPQPFLPIAVIKFFLFRVGQHLIGKANFFKLYWKGTEHTYKCR